MIEIGKVYQKFQEYIKDFDYSKYTPFIHGTTTERAKGIEKYGLLSRRDCKEIDENIAQCNIWGDGVFKDKKSKDDKTYFETCMEFHGIGKRACEYAWQADAYMNGKGRKWIHKEVEKGKYKDRNDFYNTECRFLRIKDPKKYFNKLSMDEDAIGVKKGLKQFYSNEDLKDQWGVTYGCLAFFRRMPDKLIDFYDLLYLYGGKELSDKAIEETPEELFSIAEWGTLAIDGSIPSEDLETLSYDDYKKEGRCNENYSHRDKLEYKDKQIYAFMHSTHSKEYIDLFKEYIDKNLEKKVKKIGL